MKIQRTSAQSGITRTLDLDLTLDEYAAWRGGELIQNAMPRLNADEREFLMTGITAEEWEKMFSTQEV
jgi:7,8-dihydro-6-hydroxymethylpterin-pyrophosphokinase